MHNLLNLKVSTVSEESFGYTTILISVYIYYLKIIVSLSHEDQTLINIFTVSIG